MTGVRRSTCPRPCRWWRPTLASSSGRGQRRVECAGMVAVDKPVRAEAAPVGEQVWPPRDRPRARDPSPSATASSNRSAVLATARTTPASGSVWRWPRVRDRHARGHQRGRHAGRRPHGDDHAGAGDERHGRRSSDDQRRCRRSAGVTDAPSRSRPRRGRRAADPSRAGRQPEGGGTTSTRRRRARRPCTSPRPVIPMSCCLTSGSPVSTGSTSSAGCEAGRPCPSSCCRSGRPRPTRWPRSTSGPTTT